MYIVRMRFTNQRASSSELHISPKVITRASRASFAFGKKRIVAIAIINPFNTSKSRFFTVVCPSFVNFAEPTPSLHPSLKLGPIDRLSAIHAEATTSFANPSTSQAGYVVEPKMDSVFKC